MLDLNFYRNKNARFIIGLMTGTSCDGVDAVLVRVKGTGPGLAMKLLEYKNFPYPPAFRTRLLSEHLNAKDICLLNFEVGEKLAEAAKTMQAAAKGHGVLVDFIASHGQTVAHIPPRDDHDTCGTLQIGEPAVITERTGLMVVSDFRPRDMAAGGQGAPLVPYADWLIWRNKKEVRSVACLNIGGIANFTVVTPEFSDIMAFDTGPGNMAIDGAMRLLTQGNKEYDKDGSTAAKGMVIDEFMEYLLGHRYFTKVPPKSTGKEEFGAEVYLRDALANRREHSTEDLMCTVTSAVARSIVDAYTKFIKPYHDIQHVIVGGGGAMNKTLMGLLQRGFAPLTVFTTEQFGMPNGAREAICFAILGNETIMGTPANVPQATGAKHAAVLGKITPP